ncbi:MAG TPA: hypothetical protein VIG71_11640 [Enteractinococcus sp.]
MRHLAFLRVYVPLERLPERLHQLARNAANLSRADIEAEAAERLNRRLRPDAFSLAPRSSDPPIIRVLEAVDLYGETRQYFHVNYLERAAFESQYMRRRYYDDGLYNRLVPPKTLATLEKISELQADAGLISRPVPNMRMELWNVPLAWLATFTGDPEDYDYQATTESIVDGTRVVRRVRDFYIAFVQVSWIHRYFDTYGPDPLRHPYRNAIVKLHRWLSDYQIRRPFDGLIELDYGALTRYAWPDKAGQLLAEGHAAIERIAQLEDDMETEFYEAHGDDATFEGIPPVMLEQAANIMQAKYQAATKVWQRIGRYEHAN